MSRRHKSPHRATPPVYHGRFGKEQAERLLWRAGFGPRKGEAQRLAKLGMARAVKSLIDHRGATKLHGPPVHLENNEPLEPRDVYGHDHLYWFDRMVRSNNPLQERMTLIWHDWFATSNDGVGNQGLMLNQNDQFRRLAMGSFKSMLLAMTSDPAMLIWLSGNENTKSAPNENYGREMMELFTLGAGSRYTEDDVRENARALTGWTNDYNSSGPTNFRLDPKRHDDGVKTIFKQSGDFGWQDSVNLCINHPDHAKFFVTKLWSYFIPVPLKGRNLKALESIYVHGGYKIKPVVRAILMHPALYNGPRMVKPPIVHSAGLLRAAGNGIDTDSWVWIAQNTGQRLFYPPNVGGWNDDAWLDTGTFRARWNAASQASDKNLIDPKTLKYDEKETPQVAVAKAIAYWGNPTISTTTQHVLLHFAQSVQHKAGDPWQQKPYRVMRQNALRTLIGACPDLQTS